MQKQPELRFPSQQRTLSVSAYIHYPMNVRVYRPCCSMSFFKEYDDLFDPYFTYKLPHSCITLLLNMKGYGKTVKDAK